MTRRILVSVLAFLLGMAILAVSIDEMVSRNETEWTDGGGRHITELESVKLSEGE